MITDTQLALLQEFDTDTSPHSGSTLIDHLVGTHNLLATWGNPEHVCLGGLFHSIYGTQAYTHQSASWEHRDRIRQAIGEAAEQLAYLFCVTDRRGFFTERGKSQPTLHDRVHDQPISVSPNTLRELIEIEIANCVEQLPRTGWNTQGLLAFKAGIQAAQSDISPLGYQAIVQVIEEKLTAKERP